MYWKKIDWYEEVHGNATCKLEHHETTVAYLCSINLRDRIYKSSRSCHELFVPSTSSLTTFPVDYFKIVPNSRRENKPYQSWNQTWWSWPLSPYSSGRYVYHGKFKIIHWQFLGYWRSHRRSSRANDWIYWTSISSQAYDLDWLSWRRSKHHCRGDNSGKYLAFDFHLTIDHIKGSCIASSENWAGIRLGSTYCSAVQAKWGFCSHSSKSIHQIQTDPQAFTNLWRSGRHATPIPMSPMQICMQAFLAPSDPSRTQSVIWRVLAGPVHVMHTVAAELAALIMTLSISATIMTILSKGAVIMKVPQWYSGSTTIVLALTLVIPTRLKVRLVTANLTLSQSKGMVIVRHKWLVRACYWGRMIVVKGMPLVYSSQF